MKIVYAKFNGTPQCSWPIYSSHEKFLALIKVATLDWWITVTFSYIFSGNIFS